jgi:predicted phosphodiesterase
MENSNEQKLQLQIMSDLHIELLKEDPNIEDYIIPKTDILVLAGDIGKIYKYDQLKIFLEKLSVKFKHILYVLGNHEFYRINNIEEKEIEELIQDVENMKIKNLHILNRNSVIIQNICIIGCTLWSNAIIPIPKFIVRIKKMNNKYYNTLHLKDLNYIQYMINYCKNNKLKLVVITHHCPTYKLLENKENDDYISLYGSHLDHLLKNENIHTWIFGHNHKNFDYITENGTRLVSNQKGKPKDNIQDFSKEKIIIID